MKHLLAPLERRHLYEQTNQVKWCGDCGNYRAWQDFGRARGHRYGLADYCKQHHSARNKAKYHERKFKVKSIRARG